MSDNSFYPFVETAPHLKENCKPNMTARVEVCKLNIAGYSLDKFQTLYPEGHTILCRLGETCDGLNFFPSTSKIVLNMGNQSGLELGYRLQNFLPNIAKDLGITEKEAIQTITDFFDDKNIVVQPVGVQGKVYNFMRTAQNYFPMAYTSQAVAIIKTSGLTGVQVITRAPLTFVGATYIGAMFFGYCGGITGDNYVGLILNSTSHLL